MNIGEQLKEELHLIHIQKYLKGVDMYSNEDGKIVQVSEDRRIHRILWIRTVEVAFLLPYFLFFDGLPNCTFTCNFTNEI